MKTGRRGEHQNIKQHQEHTCVSAHTLGPPLSLIHTEFPAQLLPGKISERVHALPRCQMKYIKVCSAILVQSKDCLLCLLLLMNFEPGRVTFSVLLEKN